MVRIVICIKCGNWRFFLLNVGGTTQLPLGQKVRQAGAPAGLGGAGSTKDSARGLEPEDSAAGWKRWGWELVP